MNDVNRNINNKNRPNQIEYSTFKTCMNAPNKAIEKNPQNNAPSNLEFLSVFKTLQVYDILSHFKLKEMNYVIYSFLIYQHN